MIKSISINLADTGTGTTAQVIMSRRKFLFWREQWEETYTCTKTSAIAGGDWVNTVTGLPASDDVRYQLNLTAQHAARLRIQQVKDELARLLKGGA